MCYLCRQLKLSHTSSFFVFLGIFQVHEFKDDSDKEYWKEEHMRSLKSSLLIRKWILGVDLHKKYY